jgi:hypothetical protein
MVPMLFCQVFRVFFYPHDLRGPCLAADYYSIRVSSVSCASGLIDDSLQGIFDRLQGLGFYRGFSYEKWIGDLYYGGLVNVAAV